MAANEGPRRIGYVLARYPSETETFIARELCALMKQGWEPRIFALRSGDRPNPPVDVERVPTDVRYRSPLLSGRVLSALTRLAATRSRRMAGIAWDAWVRAILDGREGLVMLRNLSAAWELADAVKAEGLNHIHAHFAYAAADVAGMAAALAGVPFSLSVHARDIYAQRPSTLRRRCRRAAFVVACSEAGRKHLVEDSRAVDAGRVRLIRHGVFPEKFHAARGGEPLIVGVGRLEPKKGFSDLVEACRQLRSRGENFRCTIAGAGAEALTLEGLVRECGLADAISLPGALSHADVVQLMNRACVLAAPSVMARDGDRDGLPNVALEAMAMSLPVIATTASAAGEAVTDGGNGYLVPPGDPLALANRLSALLNDEPLRKRMGEEGRQLICKEFDISRNIEKLIELFLSAGESGEAKCR